MPVTASHKQGAAEPVAAPLAMRLSSKVLQPSAQLQAHAPSAHTHASPPQRLPEQATSKGIFCRHTGSAGVRHSRKRRDACKASAAQEADPPQTKHVKCHRQGLAVVAPGTTVIHYLQQACKQLLGHMMLTRCLQLHLVLLQCDFSM